VTHRNIYLHFLDRELRDSVGWNPKEKDLLGLLLAGLCLAPGALYCSYSHLWESHLQFPQSFGTIREMLGAGMVIASSKNSTVDEFLVAHQALYEHDRLRYPMYFRPRLIQQIGTIQPGIVVSKGATEALVKQVPTRAHESIVAGTEGDIRAARIIDKSFKHRKHEAVMATMFAPYANNDRESLLRIRRIISLEYTRHYMATCSADILSGVCGLGHYDSLAADFPFYDAKWFLALLSFSGLSLSKEAAFQNAIENVAMQISQPSRAHFLLQWRTLITGIRRITCADNSVQAALNAKHQMFSELLRFAGALRPSKSSKFSLNELNGFLGTVLYAARRGPKGAFFPLQEDPIKSKIVLLVATDTEYRKIACGFATCSAPLSSAILPKLAAWTAGLMNGYEIWVVRCEAGTMDQSGAMLATQDVIQQLRPKFIVMIGIAFGLKPKKQKLGHILVAKCLKDYETSKVTDTSTVDRGAMPECSVELLSKARMVDWDRTGVHFGQVISGCKLANSEKLIEELGKRYPEAIGGEMEGIGLSAACQRNQVEWILIKGICDWGKNKNDRFQSRAAAHAVDFCIKMIKLLPAGNAV